MSDTKVDVTIVKEAAELIRQSVVRDFDESSFVFIGHHVHQRPIIPGSDGLPNQVVVQLIFRTGSSKRFDGSVVTRLAPN